MITPAFADDLRRHAHELVKIARECSADTAEQLESLAIGLLAKVGKQEQDAPVLLGETPPADGGVAYPSATATTIGLK